MKLRNIILIISGLAIVSTIGVVMFKDGQDQPLVVEQSVQLPETIFDKEYIFLGTGITVVYPEAGFYELGAKVSIAEENDEIIGKLHTEPIEHFDATRTSQFVIMNVMINKTASIVTLEDAVDAIPSSGFAAEYAEQNGKYISVNGQPLFIYRVSEDATTWTALGVHNDFNISATLTYTGSDYPESLAAYENNDELFLKILSNIKFE